jgi:hypothetical protein
MKHKLEIRFGKRESKVFEKLLNSNPEVVYKFTYAKSENEHSTFDFIIYTDNPIVFFFLGQAYTRHVLKHNIKTNAAFQIQEDLE